jgi:ribosomal-protein-alanine N-acetyltransferase
LSYYVRPMTRDDLTDVTDIDREAFSTQWPPADYVYEFKNRMAHYLVACDSTITTKQDGSERKPGKIKSWFMRLFGRDSATNSEVITPKHYIVGFAGFWVMAGEAHITSIAVRERYRRKGIGELLMIAVIDLAITLNSTIVTLEVRVSNTNAQDLYTKYGFNKVGERKKYYLDRSPSGDSREDAIIMTTDDIMSAAYQEQLHQLKKNHVTK